MTPSSRTLFQVSMRVNQSSGGGLVVPRRKATMKRCGRTGWREGRGEPELVAGLEVGDLSDGQCLGRRG